jgi:diguanylate cyclase (GGDEF)-like protein
MSGLFRGGASRRSIEDGIAVLLDDSHELLTIVDDDGLVTWLSPAATRWLGPSAAGQALTALVHPTDAGPLGAVLADLIDSQQGRRTTTLPCRLRDAAGAFRPMELTVSDRRGHATIGGFVCVARAAVDRSGVAVQMIYQATHDTLTALPNRSSLLDRLDVGGDDAAERPCAVLYLDLDGFKAVNDTYGHAAGDTVLVEVANQLRRVVRPDDIVARLHGDEFVIVLAGVADSAVALEIAGRIIACVREPIRIQRRPVSVSASVGISLGCGARAATLLEEADRAMFGAKQAGKNRCALFSSEMRRVDDHRHATEDLLRDALDDHGLTVLYEPIVDLGTGALTGVQAQLRIRRADGCLVAPGDFLDIAEETGLSVAVGSGLLDLACAQAARWRAEFGAVAPAILSVPMSRRQLADLRVADRVAAILDDHSLDAAGLCLDLPTGSLADAGSDIARSLELLKGLGVRLAIDGFGIGRSNLSYLRRFSVDLLRIDRSFMAGLGRDDIETEVVRAVVGLGRALGMTTVATGVETGPQARLLHDIGCHLAQGTYFGRPALAEQSPLRLA